MQHALLFFPDISGYTSFVTTTERLHSGHLITELLEIVIAENNLGMEVQEVEGDAVFFLRSGAAPPVSEIVAQARSMFLAFHAHLRVIERDNVCQCGACRSASNMTLKFIVHYGAIEKSVVAGKKNVFGSDVIFAHRLMKTGVPERAYLLIPETYPDIENGVDINTEAESGNWAVWQEYEEAFEHFGQKRLRYLPLAALMDQVPSIDRHHDATPQGSAGKIVRMHIDAPLLLVHALLTDPESKKRYVPDLKDSVTPTPINRVNASHTCVFDDFEVHFVTRQNAATQDEIIYKESGEVSVGFSFISDYRLRERDGGTDVRLRIFPASHVDENARRSSGFLQNWKRRLLFLGASLGAKKGLILFKNFCEDIAKSDEGKPYFRIEKEV